MFLPHWEGCGLAQPVQCLTSPSLVLWKGWAVSSCPHAVPPFAPPLHGDDHTCLPRSLVDVSTRLQMGDVVNVSSNHSYVTSWEHRQSPMCSPFVPSPQKWCSGS